MNKTRTAIRALAAVALGTGLLLGSIATPAQAKGIDSPHRMADSGWNGR